MSARAKVCAAVAIAWPGSTAHLSTVDGRRGWFAYSFGPPDAHGGAEQSVRYLGRTAKEALAHCERGA